MKNLIKNTKITTQRLFILVGMLFLLATAQQAQAQDHAGVFLGTWKGDIWKVNNVTKVRVGENVLLQITRDEANIVRVYPYFHDSKRLYYAAFQNKLYNFEAINPTKLSTIFTVNGNKLEINHTEGSYILTGTLIKQ